MSSVTQLRPKAVAFRYKHGDITSSLRLALDHPEAAEDLEQAFDELLFGTDDPEHDQDYAREMLFKILEAANGLTQETSGVRHDQ